MSSSKKKRQAAKKEAKKHKGRKGRWPGWLRGILWTLAVLVLALAGGAALLAYSPKAQTWVAGQFLRYAKGRTGFTGRAEYVFVDVKTRHATVRNIEVIDLQSRPMFDLPEVVIAFSWDSVMRRNVTFDTARVDHGCVNIVTNEKLKSTNITEFVDTIQAWVNGPPRHDARDTVHRKGPPIFRINHIHMNDMELIVSNESRDTIKTGIDYNHLHFMDLKGIMTHFRARADTLEFNTARLSTHDKRTGWPIRQVKTKFRMTRHNMVLSDMLIEAGHTTLRHQMGFYFQRPKDLSDFNNKIFVRAHLKNSHIDSRDLTLFARPLRKYHDKIEVHDLRVAGMLGNFAVKHFDLDFGKSSHVQGKLAMQGLPKAKAIRIEATVIRSHVAPADIYQYVPDSIANGYIARMGVNDMNGSFNGTAKKFLIKADAKGDAGKVHVDLAMTLSSKDSSTYKGRFEAQDFALGHFADTKYLGQYSGRGYVDGIGLDLRKAHIQLKTHIDEIHIMGIPIRRVALNGTLEKHKLRNLLSSIKLFKSGPFYKPGKMNKKSDFGLGWEKG